MGRTLRSKKLRSLLYYSQNGKCAICGRDLPDDWHADHIIPHVVTHRTNVHEMQALCPTCNWEKGSKSVFVFDWSACRRGTQEVLRTAASRFSGGEKEMSIIMPTRYGKTPTGRLLSGISTRGWITPEGLHIKPFASVNVWVTINLLLRAQAAEKDKWEADSKIFQISTPLRYGQIQDGYDTPKHFCPNGEEYLSINIQKILNSGNGNSLVNPVFLDWIDSLLHNPTGKRLPPIFHFDECHFYGTNKPYGKIIEQLKDAGALVVTWTATPVRSDGGIIPGFETYKIGEMEEERSVLTDTIEKDGKRFGIFEKQRVLISDYGMDAHVSIPFSEAWSNGYLLKVNHRKIDVEVSEIDGAIMETKRNVMLSELTESTLRKNGLIGKLVRSPKVVRNMVQAAYEQLKWHRLINPRAAVVGFTVGDRDGGKDEHAGMVKREFLKLDPSLKIDIATLNVDNSLDTVNAFPENDHDVILFKQMGGVGWDCPRACVVLDLGDDRQDASAVQKWMRGGTPDKLNRTFSLVTLQDATTMSIFKRCIDNEGGKATEKEAQTVGLELKELKMKDKPTWVTERSETGDFSDNDGNLAERTYAPTFNGLMEIFPEIKQLSTDASIIDRLKRTGYRFDASTLPPAEKNIDEQISEYQEDIIAILDRAHRKLFAQVYGQYDKSKAASYGETRKTVYRMCYQRAGLSYDNDYVEVRKNRNLEQLVKLERGAQLVEEDVKRYEDLTV